MLGHPYRQIRDFAVVALNVLYDGVKNYNYITPLYYYYIYYILI